MMPSPVNLSTVPPYRCTTAAAAVDQLGHDLAQPLCTDGRRDVHRMNNIGEQHRHLLVLRRSSGLCERCTALVTELGVRWQFDAARPTEQPRRGQSTATIPAGVHVSIVSPLVSDVRHIAMPPPTRTFETHICRLFRDSDHADWSSLHKIFRTSQQHLNDPLPDPDAVCRAVGDCLGSSPFPLRHFRFDFLDHPLGVVEVGVHIVHGRDGHR